MRRLRVLFFLLLSIAVPLQGYAHFAVPKVPCPMEQTSMMDSADAVAMHDCCNDAETAAKTGSPCKSAQPCQSAGLFLPFPEREVLSQSLASSVRFPQRADSLFSFDPAATWRPPAPF
ncbi:MAG: hypothetical protein ACYCZS_07880 [Thiobacillus sp.]